MRWLRAALLFGTASGLAIALGALAAGIARHWFRLHFIGVPHGTFIACFALAIALTCFLESPLSRRMNKKAQEAMMWGVLFLCSGCCIGIVAMLLVLLFHLSDWVAIAMAVPFGFPGVVLLGRISEV